ncbi:hypothetical protein EMCG_04595 [[Emmonsia] crescens]|uniref:Aminoglycoside phosphotransferase domain-containing protein n=1 Tax=[Emmonsia] crescens TaxID=73230 RepID=A0A0G2J7B0_9EURO|nr:hypothetical protein EMCG_04595 [Emmonsia crescens UAMH 3008]
MWEPVALPFKNDSLPLPTLPTPDEIRACPNILWERFGFASKVVAINDEIVVKFGTSLNASEGQALIYLERHVPTVPAPRLYAMYRDSNQLFLVMQRAPGVPLNSIWPSLTKSEKDGIVAKLRQAFDVLRQAECPWPDFYGSLDSSGVHHYLFSCQEGSRKHLGPFYGEAAFVEGLISNYRTLIERRGCPDFKTRAYETYLTSVLKGHRPTLTHGDVHMKNIVVAENASRRDQGMRSFDVVLVDWEAAGWYPDFWEFFCAASSPLFLSWEDDWCWRIHEFLEVWAAEMATMLLIKKDWI